MANDVRKWFAVQAEPRKEARAKRHLLELGVDVFWPHYLAEVRGSDWVIDKSNGMRRRVQARGYGFRSWLPGNYMFVADDLAQARRLREANMGIIGIYYFGGKPLEIPYDLILEEFMAIAEPSGLIPRTKAPPPKMIHVTGENFLDVIARLNRGKKAVAWATGLMSSTRRLD